VKSFDYRLETLKSMMLQAYHEKEKLDSDDRWHLNVMGLVRKIGPLPVKPDPLVQFGQFVWRLSPVTCLLIVMSAAVLLKFDFTPDYNVLIAFITDVEEVSLVQLLPL